MNPLAAMDHAGLFRDSFADMSSWRRWRSFVAAFFGLPLAADGLEDAREFTGRAVVREGGYPEGIVLSGRRGGKSTIAAMLAVYEAAVAPDGAGDVLLVSQDHRASLRVIMSHARRFARAGVLASEVVRESGDTLEFRNGRSIYALPCTSEAPRGLKLRFAALDEIAHYRTSENVPRAAEIVRSVRPALLDSGGRLLAVSTPYSASGWLHETFRKHYGRDESTVLVWQMPLAAANPTIPKDRVERLRAEDPEGAVAELDAGFLAGIAAFLDVETVEAATMRDVREIEPRRGVAYCAAVDASGGVGRDAFAAGIAHCERDGDRVVSMLDAVRAIRGRIDLEATVREIAVLCASYRVTSVCGDRFASGFTRQLFEKAGLDYREPRRGRLAGSVTERAGAGVTRYIDKSAAYEDFGILLRTGRVRLLDNADLRRELLGLEKRTSGGATRIDHPRGAHDDIANVAALALREAAVGRRSLLDACAPECQPIYRRANTTLGDRAIAAFGFEGGRLPDAPARGWM